MKPTKQQLLEVKSALKEMDERWNGQDIKAADLIVQALSKMPSPSSSTNDKTVIDAYHEAASIRRELMKYIETKTGYRYVAKDGNTWKLVKK